MEKASTERCKNCAKIYHENYGKEHKNELIEYRTNYYLCNKEKIKKYRQDNKSRIRQYNNVYELQRKKTDPVFKLRKSCSRLINHALQGSKRGQSILRYLPYTMEELKIHLENGFDDKMTWENHGIYWHIDHIIPQSRLPYTSMDDENFKKCWALENLQPLEAIENMKKSNKLMVK